MSAKYRALLEACDNIQYTGQLNILEESSLDEKSQLKLKICLNENVQFIRDQISKTALVENVQAGLAALWTQAILEDLDLSNLPYVQDEGLSNAELAGLGAAGAGLAGAGALYGAPAVKAAYNARKNSGANLTGMRMAAQQAAGAAINRDIAAAKNMYNNAAAAGANAGANVSTAVKNMYNNAAAAGANAGANVSTAAKNAYNTTAAAATAANTGLGKVKRVFKK